MPELVPLNPPFGRKCGMVDGDGDLRRERAFQTRPGGQQSHCLKSTAQDLSVLGPTSAPGTQRVTEMFASSLIGADSFCEITDLEATTSFYGKEGTERDARNLFPCRRLANDLFALPPKVVRTSRATNIRSGTERPFTSNRGDQEHKGVRRSSGGRKGCEQ